MPGEGPDFGAVRQELDAGMLATPKEDRDWNVAPLAELIQHIVATHHAYLRREMPAINARLEKVYQKTGMAMFIG